MNLHTREDEYSYVLEGRMGAQLGEKIVHAGPADLVFKPRNQWHTFWNAGDEPCRILEIIAPAGFENFFKELDALGGAIDADPDELTELAAHYGHSFRLEASRSCSSVRGVLEPRLTHLRAAAVLQADEQDVRHQLPIGCVCSPRTS